MTKLKLVSIKVLNVHLSLNLRCEENMLMSASNVFFFEIYVRIGHVNPILPLYFELRSIKNQIKIPFSLSAFNIQKDL